jgi:uncharacterized protein YkwD
VPDYLLDWYYIEPNWRGNTFVRGPYTIEQMRGLVENGTISGKTQVRCGVRTLWRPLREVQAIFRKPSPKGNILTNRLGLTRNQKTLTVGIAIFIAILVILQLWRTPKQSVSGGLFHQETLDKQAIIGLTNNTRIQHGLPVLKDNQLLDAVAESRAKDMFEKQYMAHVSPTGEQASDIAQKVGYQYKIIAENIASGLFFTNQKIVDGWMQSPGHRKNLLSAEVQDIGVSVIKGKLHGAETWLSVQIFGLPSLPVSDINCLLPSQTLLKDINVKKAEIALLSERVTRLKQELDGENDSIETDRGLAGNDPRKNQDLNLKIRQFNEKSIWHNQSIAEIKAKETILDSMVQEYNRTILNYKACADSR